MKSGWQRVSLGDVCTIVRVQGHHDDLPYVGLEDIEPHSGAFIGSMNRTEVKSSTFKFSKEHLLYGRLRPYLNKVMAPNFAGHCSTEIIPLRPDSAVSRKFLQYWLLREETCREISRSATGARMPRANMNAVLALDLMLPSSSDQDRIARILDNVFESIAVAKRNCARNRQNAVALYDLSREELLRDEEFRWERKSIAELCTIKHGFAFKGEYFATSGQHVVLTPGNFYEAGGYRDRGDKQKFYSGEIPANYVLDKGDLVVAMTEQAAGLLGSPIIVPESGKFLHNQRLGLVKKKPGVPWVNEFFFHVLNTRHVRNAIHDSASGVKVRHTSPAKIGNVVVPFPAKVSEQLAIIEMLDRIAAPIGSLEAIYQRKLAALDELQQSLLHQAFTGQL